MQGTQLHLNCFLDTIDCQIHFVFKVLICMFCGSAWAPFVLLGHCKQEHPDIKVEPNVQLRLGEIVEDYGIVSEVALPEFDGLPVEGLKEHNDGLICLTTSCSYACQTPASMDQHWMKNHQGSTTLKVKHSCSGLVQCFFTSTGCKYFTVNKSLVGVDPEGLYATFIHDYLPSLPP